MNGIVTEGKMYDSTLVVVAMHSMNLDALEWYETSQSMRIDYHKDFRTSDITIKVYGLPYDIPTDVYEDFLDTAIRFSIKNEKAAKVKQTTRNWLTNYRKRNVLA